MDPVRKKTATVGVVTLMVGVALGIGIGVWGVGNTHASNAGAGGLFPNRNSNPAGTTTKKNQPNDTTLESGDAWDPFREMERMHAEIDRAIRNATAQFQFGPGASVFRRDSGYSSQLDVRDRKDHFELRAYLPDAEASDVNVKIDNDRIVQVSVGHRKQEVQKDNAGEAKVMEFGQYEQAVTLPEAVRSADMKVERNGHEVIITVPKGTGT